MTTSHIHPKMHQRAARNLGNRREGIASDQRISTEALETAITLLKALDGLPEAERGEVDELITIYTWVLVEVREIDPNNVLDTGRLTTVRAVLHSCTARLSALETRVTPRRNRAVAV